MAPFDPYKILGIASTATQDEIKAAYRKLAKKLHPDLNPGNKEIENQFKQVNKAYELVGTAENRAKFDRGETKEQQEEQFRNQSRRYSQGREQGPFYYETQWEPNSRYSGSFEGFDPSMFEDLFGEFGQQGERGGRRRKSSDQNYSMEIDFQTSILGGEREITLPAGKRLSVKIPAGIKNHQKIRLASPDGDIYIEMQVSPSPFFRRVENDIEIDLPISLSEAILGVETKVPTVDGEVLLKIPKGLSSGSKIRIKGKGVPFGSKQRGDQFAVIKIVVPKVHDPKLEKFVEDWSKEHPFNPREDWPRSQS